ncbi:type I restriction endonuclease subunit R [Clostridium perfringens]|nr:type I restriction endonuclease subunit R [Clostridium perfringens]
MAFEESNLESLIVDLIRDKDYKYVHGDNLIRQFEDVLIEEDLRNFLSKKYKDNRITDNEIEQIIMSLKSISSTPVYNANKTAFKKIVEGEVFVREDRSQKDFYLQLIDFNDIDNNIFKVCNQVVIKGPQAKRIPDTIIYINGLPIVVWEYKSTTREEATIYDAYVQLTTRYIRDIPELFKYNAFVVISDGINSKMGSLFADYEHFYAWRKVEEKDDEVDGIDSLYTMIDGLFRRDRLIDVIHNFVYFPDDSCKKSLKIVCNYPQYFAATKLYQNILEHQKPNGDGKGGTYFGTTGCGKSYGMLFLTRLLVHSKDLQSPTVVLITDRTDLNEQLSNNFMISKDFIGDGDVECVASREDLKTKLGGKASGGVYLTTIQKFTDAISLLSDRNNIVCISDEAHRSQINLDQKMKIKDDEVITTYGYAKYLHDSLPNATYVGFTGTPIDETIEVFGGIVEEYTMKDSIKDEITVRLVYDGRFVKAVLDSEKLAEIENYYKKCLDDGANEYQVEESKKKSISIRSIIGNKEILTNVAKYFVEHYENRVNEGSTVAGKCMFVCADRFIAYDFYKIVKEMRPDWVVEKKCPDGVTLTKDEEKKLKLMPMMKMVMTRGKDDPTDLYGMLGTDNDRSEAATQFKDIKSNFKIAIVVDMWLTGFDVPFLDTIYIDKLLTQEHNIIQTISRVNRAFPNKESGLIVDFIGIKHGMNLALKKYAKYEDGNVEGIEQAIIIVKDQLEVIDKMMVKFDSSKYFNGTNAEKFKCLNDAAEFIQATKEIENRFMANVRRMSKAFGLCNGSKDFTDEELDKIHYYMAVRSIVFKLTKGKAPDISQMNKKVQAMIQEAIKSNEVEELFSETKDLNAATIDLFDKKYLEKINKIKMPNTKIKILQQLLSQAIEEFKKVNKIKAVSFSERMKSIVDAYNLRAMDDAEIQEILDKVAKELIDLMDKLTEEKDSFEELGINYEEKAFYDVLISVEEKYNFSYPEDKNIELSKEIYKLVTDKTKYSDWSNRTDIKAGLQVDIIRLLSKYGFPAIPKGTMPPEDYEKVYTNVIEQTENFKKYYNC